MSELIMSNQKFKCYKSKFIYFNHHQEMKSLNNADWDLMPQDYLYFMKNNHPHDVLSFYNSYCGFYLFHLENKKVDREILKTIGSLTVKNQTDIILVMKNNKDLWNRLLNRSHATYNIDLDRSKGSNVTHSLLHYYSSSYENTEILFILYWICQKLTKQSLTTNFDKYKDSFGNYQKGRLINSILRILKRKKKFNDFRNIIRDAYHKEIRHLSFHNSATLDDRTKKIINIDKPSIQIPYTTFFSSMYSLQQLQNFLRMYINILLIEKEDVINEGVILGITLHEEDNTSTLCLLQLEPFYNFDHSNDSQIQTISVSLLEDLYIFKTDKEILRLEKDSILNKWYESSSKKEISVYSIHPDLFLDDKKIFKIDHTEYGSFIVKNYYNIKYVNLSY